MKYFGLFLIALGITMFIIGVGAFASQGKMNFILANFGEVSFKWWLPTLLIGIVIIGLRASKNK